VHIFNSLYFEDWFLYCYLTLRLGFKHEIKHKSVERAYSEEKVSHCLANPRVRGLYRVKTHVYLALCAQMIKRIGTAMMERLNSLVQTKDNIG
jgi:hypothetical protein